MKFDHLRLIARSSIIPLRSSWVPVSSQQKSCPWLILEFTSMPKCFYAFQRFLWSLKILTSNGLGGSSVPQLASEITRYNTCTSCLGSVVHGLVRVPITFCNGGGVGFFLFPMCSPSSQCVPNSSSLYPVFFSLSPTLLIYICSPKEEITTHLFWDFFKLEFIFLGWTNQGYPSQTKKKKIELWASPQPINMSQ
jgi:hypothetical protein